MRFCICCDSRPVHVNSYERCRFGNLEQVREHCRSYPHQHQYKLYLPPVE